MNREQLKKLLVNPGGRAFLRYPRRYCICNEFGAIAFVWAESEQDAIDEAADSGHLDSELMSTEDYAECLANGLDDSYMYAGNASETFWCASLAIREI